MGNGASTISPSNELSIYTSLSAEYEKLQGEDESVQFAHMKKVFAENVSKTQTSVEQHAAAHKQETKRHFKTLARLARKVTKRHFERGTKSSNLGEHFTSKGFNQVCYGSFGLA